MTKYSFTKNLLSSRMAGYASAAGITVALGSNISGQVIYSGVRDTLVTDHLSTFNLNLDNDSEVDFNLGVWLKSNGYFTNTNSAYIDAASSNSNQWIALPGGTAIAIDEGVMASVSLYPGITYEWRKIEKGWNLGSYGYAPSAEPFGNFAGTGDKFIALQFYIGTEIHYGWVRINLTAKCNLMEIRDWAYETTPEKGIAIGILEVDMSAADTVQGPFDVEILFSKSVADMSQDSLEISNGNISDFSGSDSLYTVTIQPVDKGEVKIRLKEGAATYLTNIKSLRKEIIVYYDDVILPVNKINTDADEVKIYPVPVTNTLNIETKNASTITLTDLNGKIIYSIENTPNLKLDVTDYPRGMYILSIVESNRVFNRKILIR